VVGGAGRPRRRLAGEEEEEEEEEEREGRLMQPKFEGS
jgi:hypothetical protein